jgi:hypothetical protein
MATRTNHAAALERLRAGRNRPERDLSVSGIVASQKKALAKQHRELAGVWASWAAGVPARLLDRTTLVGVSRGVLTVRVADAAARFELDRFLRTGGEIDLVRRAPIGVRKIKLVL